MSTSGNGALEEYIRLQKLPAPEQILARQNLLILDSKDFASNRFSHLLVNDVFKKVEMKIPRILISIVPLKPKPDLLPIHSEGTHSWIENNNRNLEPLKGNNLIWTHEKRILQNSLLYPQTAGNEEASNDFRRYFEFQANGYIEYGLSGDVTNASQTGKAVVSLRGTVGRLWMLANFAKNYYKEFKYNDEFELILSLANVKGFALGGFGGKTQTSGWAEPYGWEYENPPTNQYDTNIQIKRNISVDQKVDGIVRSIAEELSRAFGEDIVKCYNHDGTFAEGFRL